MITTTMNYAEIKSELDKDLKSVLNYVNKFSLDNKYRREALKHTNRIWFKPVRWKSPHHNNYIILIESLGKSDFKKNGFVFYIFCYYFNNKNKLDVAMFTNMNDYVFYSGHLFERYAERFLNNKSMDKMDVIIKYFKSNRQTAFHPFESSKYGNSIFGTTSDGVVLGNIINGMGIFKTYITFDMLRGEEVDYNVDNSSSLEELKSVCNTKEFIQEMSLSLLCKVGYVA